MIRPVQAAGADGLAARRAAVQAIADVTRRRLALDETLDRVLAAPAFAGLAAADRGFARAIATSAVRRLGTIRRALADRLASGMPPRSGLLEPILIAGAAQILALGAPAHAAVDTSVRLAREDAHARHFVPLVNAVLRRIAAERDAILAAADPLAADAPVWLAERWTRTYGRETAAAIAAAHRREPTLDITVKAEPERWAERLGATLLPTGSLRLAARDAVRTLPGYAEGAWWVQDAAAALPARLLGDVRALRVLDMCAAPGGKTAQLAAAGASVVALDRSPARMATLAANMARLGLQVETVVADALAFEGPPFDAILLDAPCSATGTIRRHPDVQWARTLEDVLKLAALQAKLLDKAAGLLRPGGRLVYATCSLEPEEGEAQVQAFLARTPNFRRERVEPSEVGGLSTLLTEDGALRTLPVHLPHPDERMAGLDGFFAARLVRAGG